MNYRQKIANGLTAYRPVLLWACVVCIMISAGCRRKPKTETTVGMDSPAQTWIRVLLFGNLRRCTVASENGFFVEDARNGVVAEFGTNGPLPVLVLRDKILIGQHSFGPDVTVKPRDPFVFYVNDEGYRGYLQLRVQDEALQAINHVPLESYLLGVIGAEMHSYWEPEALKAQTVAARTYCLFIKNRFGQHRSWDVSGGQSHQMYGGLKAESDSVRHAVQETAGQVLVCRYKDGRELIFPTYYSSACGGHTEKAANVFGQSGEDLEPLQGVDCPYCKDVSRQRVFYWKPASFTFEQVNEKLGERYPSLKKIEPIVDLKIIQTGYLERVIRMQVIGKDGCKDWLRGEDFRLAMDPTGRLLKSTLFEMKKNGRTVEFTNGRGFGHGVGLCQSGAQGMARKNFNYRQILSHYFPGSRLVTIWTANQ